MAKGTESLRNQAGLATQQQSREIGFPAMIAQLKEQVALALPKHMNADRMARIALTAFRQNKDLALCDPRTVFASVIIAGQLGLEIGILGQAYLVPYNVSFKDESGNWQKRKECQLIPGWRGLVDLVNRAGRATVWTGAVYKGDDFSYKLGTETEIKHVPAGIDEELTHVYAVARVKGAEYPIIEVWPVAKVRKHLSRYNKIGSSHYAVKDGGANFAAYARKVVLLQVIKYVPVSVEIQTAAELEYAATAGAQNLTIDSAVNNEWVAPEIDASLPAPAEEREPGADEAEAAGSYQFFPQEQQ
jgi:recombination protein RecT